MISILKNGSSGRRCPGIVRITSAVHCYTLPRRNLNWRSCEELHLDPPPSQGGMHKSITPQEQKRAGSNEDVAAERWIVISEHDAITPAKPHFSRLGTLNLEPGTAAPLARSGCCRYRAGLSSSSGRR